MKKNCIKCNKEFNKNPSDSSSYWKIKKFCSSRCAGIFNNTAQKLIGTKRPKEVVDKLQKTMFKKGMKSWNKGIHFEAIQGDKHPMWKGGVSKINHSERQNLMNTLEYKLWRTAVFERDNYTCIWCGKKGGELCADHIQRWVDNPELRLAIDNGRTLCNSCHLKRHSKEF
jgi:hypothetical protein